MGLQASGPGHDAHATLAPVPLGQIHRGGGPIASASLEAISVEPGPEDPPCYSVVCMGRRVWFHEMFGFFFRDKTKLTGNTVAKFLGRAQEHEEEAMTV